MNLVELTEEIVKSLVLNPEGVSVKEFASEDDNTLLILDCHSFSDKMTSHFYEEPFPDICIGVEDEYYDQEERAFMKTPSVVTIWGWEHADYYESINDYFTPVQPLHDDISPICDIYHYEWENGKLMLWGDQENGMYITLNFQNCHFRFEHVDMSHHVNIFKFMVPESILDREYADLDIPSVKKRQNC